MAKRSVWMPTAGLLFAVLVLHGYTLFQPMLFIDDFQILAGSVTWSVAYDHLWDPHNEHTMPLGRVSTWALFQAAGGQTAWPRAAALHCVFTLLVGLALLWCFVWREFGHSFYGWCATILFGVSAVHQQAIIWFAASFSVWAMNTMLLAFLAAQAWLRYGRWRSLALCALCCALAPGWFASGVIAGPLCAVYLAVSPGNTRSEERPLSYGRALGTACVPLLGTAAFLAVSLPLAAQRILVLEHYQGKTAVQAFSLTTGLVYAVRSVGDNLILGAFGFSCGLLPNGLDLPLSLSCLLAGIAGLALVWWRPVSNRRALVLGLCLIVLTYVLTYSARAEWPYEGMMNRPVMSRYHLLPQLGLALILCSALTRKEGQWLVLDPGGTLSDRQARGLTVLIAVLLLIQFPRALLGLWLPQCEQRAVLKQIEEVDNRCREHRISADTARQALDHLQVPGAHDSENGWLLLRGSSEPRALPVEEARQLLVGILRLAR